MAKLLISCDNSIIKYKGNYYYKTEEWRDFYNRYLRVFESIKIANRCREEFELGSERIMIDTDKVEIVDIPEFSGPLDYAKKYLKISKALKNVTKGCDCAILRLPSTIAQKVATKVKQAGIPYATEIVFDAKDGWQGETNLLYKYLWWRIDKIMRGICYNANGISCVTERYLQKHYYSKKTNAFVANYSTLSLNKEFFTGERTYPDNKEFVIVNVANQVEFNGRKGFKEIIMAIKVLKDRGVMVKGKFVGRDYHGGVTGLSSFAKKLGIAEQIEFMGYMSRKKLDLFLNEADIFVMPTRAEGLPRVIIEAMAKGLPSITTPVSGNPELLSSHFLVEYEDTVTLADRIEELINDRNLYKSTSKFNFESSKQYEASILEKRRDEFYQKLKNCCCINVY